MDRLISDGVATYHFDFHKNLQSPKLTSQDYYYASKLTTYAFGVHNGEGSGKGTTYLWPENVAPKHPDSLVSCLDYHLSETEKNNEKKWNIFWADNARSQNKNLTVVLYFNYLQSCGLRQRIDLKFLVSGHSFGEVDRAMGACEAVLAKTEVIETPRGYAEVINNSPLFPKITWKEMKANHFRRYSEWLRGVYNESRKDVSGKPFHLSEMAHLNYGIGERIDREDGQLKCFSHPGIVWMRKSLDPREEPIEVDFRKNPRQIINWDKQTLPLLNTQPIKLNEKKCKDLLKLSKYLSPIAQSFYNNILQTQSHHHDCEQGEEASL